MLFMLFLLFRQGVARTSHDLGWDVPGVRKTLCKKALGSFSFSKDLASIMMETSEDMVTLPKLYFSSAMAYHLKMYMIFLHMLQMHIWRSNACKYASHVWGDRCPSSSRLRRTMTRVTSLQQRNKNQWPIQ